MTYWHGQLQATNGVRESRFFSRRLEKVKLGLSSFRNFDLGLRFFVINVGSWKSVNHRIQCVLSCGISTGYVAMDTSRAARAY